MVVNIKIMQHMLFLLPQYPLSALLEVNLFFLPRIIPISAEIKMSDLQKPRVQQRFPPWHRCHFYKKVINKKIWRMISYI